MSVHTVKISNMYPGLANLYVGAYPNCLKISNKLFRVHKDNLEEQNKILETSVIIKNYWIIINLYYNYIA
jgi:hypothetical protein